MKRVTRGARRCGHWVAVVSTCSLMLVVATGPANSAGCALEPEGEGRVVEIIDARTFRLADGREVVLAGIEPVVTEKATRTSALSAILAGRDVRCASLRPPARLRVSRALRNLGAGS